MAIQTVILLMDIDNDNYQILLKKVSNTFLIGIVSSLVLACFIIYIVWMIRRKIIGIYSLFAKMYDFEYDYQIDRLTRLLEVYNTAAYSESKFSNQFVKLIDPQVRLSVYERKKQKTS